MRVMRRLRRLARRTSIRRDVEDQFDGEDWAYPTVPFDDEDDFLEAFPGGGAEAPKEGS